MDRGSCKATVHGVAKSQTRLSNFTLIPHSPMDRSAKQKISKETQTLNDLGGSGGEGGGREDRDGEHM